MKTMELTQDRLKQVLMYEPDSGIFYWISRPSNRVSIGDKAGVVGAAHGYRLIRIDGTLYRSCRLVWLYVHGRWPAEEIDHINRDRQDDRLFNLREVSRDENARNTKLRSDNKSGHRVVFLHPKLNLWLASTRVSGKSKHIGYFKTKQEAIVAYEAFSQRTLAHITSSSA